MDRAYEEKLFQSCRILFGPGIDIGWDFLFFVQAAGIKSAYRKKALLTHPDRSPIRIGENEALLNRRFIETKDACDHLLDFVRLRHTFVRPPRPGGGAAGGGQRRTHRGMPGKRGEGSTITITPFPEGASSSASSSSIPAPSAGKP